jgi:hypothetical protein
MEEEEKKEENIEELEYNPTDKQVEVINRIWYRFTKMQEERDKERDEFDERTITEYVNDNVSAYNGIIAKEIKETKEPWQSLIYNQKTRGKVKAVVSMIAAGRPFINLIGKTQADQKDAEDMRLVFEDSHLEESGQFKLYLQALSACNKGTVIVEEGYEEIKKEEKFITGFDFQTGKAITKKKTVIKGGAGKVYARIVPLLNFYPNENCADLRHDCIVLEYFKEEAFNAKYGKYAEAKYVKSGIYLDNIENIKYKSVGEDKKDVIEVMKYYNEDIDEFIILANGVWLNPQNEDEVCPLPFNHKCLPFVKSVYELADEELFYGKAMPDIMAGEQDTINALLRMTVDQEVLSIHKPILLGQGTELTSYQMFPGKTFNVSGDIEQVREMDISGTQNSTFQVLEWLDKKSDVNTAVGANTMGIHQGKKTAKEATLLDDNSKRLSGNFAVFIEELLKQRAVLRIQNISQFYKTPIQYSVLKDKYGEPILNKDGNEIKKPEYREIAVSRPGKEPFWVKVTPEKCKSLFKVSLIKDVEPNLTRQEQLAVSQILLAEAKANPLISADEATIDFILSLGKNPERFYIKPSFNEMKGSKEGKIPGGANQPNQAASAGGTPPPAVAPTQ